jgi:hypothetical protein
MRTLLTILLVFTCGCEVNKAMRIAVRQRDEPAEEFTPVVYDIIHQTAQQAKLEAITPFGQFGQYNLLYQNRRERELLVAARTVPSFVYIDITLNDNTSTRVKNYDAIRQKLIKDLGKRFTLLIHESKDLGELQREDRNLYSPQ